MVPVESGEARPTARRPRALAFLGGVAGGSIPPRAMALSYLSLFTAVPALVVAFSVIEAITGMDRIAALVHGFLLENLAVGARATIEPYLDRFTGNAHVASAGLVGGALLVWSGATLLASVDRAINDLWGIGRARPLRRRVAIYWAGLTLGPLLLAGSLVLGHAARAWLRGTGLGSISAVGGIALACAFFAGVYRTVPDTRVRTGPAVVAGVIAGVAWESAKWGYGFAVARFFRYHAIYGSVAAVPTFMLWLFVSWSVLLLGARLAYLLQAGPAAWEERPPAEREAAREELAARVMLDLARAHAAPDAHLPRDLVSVASRLGRPAAEVGAVASALERAGLLARLEGDGGWLPGRPAERISLLDVRRAIAGDRGDRSPGERHEASAEALLARALTAAAAEAERGLAAVALRDLLAADAAEDRPAGTSPAPPGPPAGAADRGGS